MRYDKELNLLSDSQQEFIERLDKTKSQLDQERNKVEEMAKKFGISIPSSSGLDERRRISAPSKKEATEAESEIESLRQEILSELEKTRRQPKK
jgi:cell division protein FtsI/penicillin-binding protein 2